MGRWCLRFGECPLDFSLRCCSTSCLVNVFLIPSNRSRVVDLSFKLTVDDFDYVIFAKTNDFKWYSCGREGHLSRACPGEHGSNRDQNRRRAEGDRGDKQDGQEGTSAAQEAGVEETGVAQKVRVEETGVTQGVRVEETGVAQKVRVEETGVAQKVRVEETGVTQKVRVEETGVAQKVRVEETGVTQGVRVEKTGVTQETRVKETGGVQEVREERTRGGQEVRKDGASEVQQVRESAGGRVEAGGEAGGEVAMEADVEQLKAPQRKRKQKGDRGLSQAKKVATTESGGAAECESRLEEEPESGWEDSESSQEDSAVSRGSGGYSVEEIKGFLKRVKNVRKARVEDYFSDKEKLSSSARSHMRSKDRGGLTKQEGFRLRKIVHKVNKELGKGGAKVRLRSQSKDN